MTDKELEEQRNLEAMNKALGINPPSDVHTVNADKAVQGGESSNPPASVTEAEAIKDIVETLAEPVVDEDKLKLDILHAELAAFADGRTEDSIGLSDPYWGKRNELQQFLHRLKDRK